MTSHDPLEKEASPDGTVFSSLTEDGKVRLLASPENWVEGEALRQLHKTAELPGMRLAVGLPDLHPGRGHPVGAAFVTDTTLYPQLIGNDVGCGMGFWQTDLKVQRFKQDKCLKRLHDLEEPWEGDTIGWLAPYGIEATESDFALGTIGSGNHFAELQAWHEIHDQQMFAELGLQKQAMSILVHSGSRGLGELLLRSHLDQHGADGLPAESEPAVHYIEAHERTRRWAVANRALIAARMAEQIRCEIQPVLDICHNSIVAVSGTDRPGWLHRKGAAPADCGPVVIPGTRGSPQLPGDPHRRSAGECLVAGSWRGATLESPLGPGPAQRSVSRQRPGQNRDRQQGHLRGQGPALRRGAASI